MKSVAEPDNIDDLAIAERNPPRSLAQQLERAKEELELISYITSHDLQAPLRVIQHLCEELETHPSVTESKLTKDIVHKLSLETDRLKTLMQGLLDYMRLETYGPSHSLIDTNEIITAALTVLDEKMRASSSRITYNTLPQVYGHRGRITRLFVYLLDNALKFNKAPIPTIHISAIHKGAWVEFCVEDNGIGVEEEYRSIVFGLFSRLHAAEEYPGNGIGLALCRKIVESHGGKIEIESVSTGGSRFRFVLPAVPIKL